jgi:hypothetical protein
MEPITPYFRRNIAFLVLVRYIFKTKRLAIQNLGVPQLQGKHYIREFGNKPLAKILI